MLKHGGIPTDDSYGSYLGNDGFCHMDDPEVVIGFQIEVKTRQQSPVRKAKFCFGTCKARPQMAHLRKM
jgi:hypothetical protein